MVERITAQAPDKAALAYAIDKGPLHWRSTWRAVRDECCNYVAIMQDSGPFRLASTRQPTIFYIGDDMLTARGPDAFDRPSLLRALSTCWFGAVVSCEPIFKAYHQAASVAVVQREDSVVVETQPEHEAAWIALLKEARPDMAMLVCTVMGRGVV